MSIYDHTPHPHTTSRLSGESPGPVKVNDGRVGLNGRIGLRLTALVGTMVCAYVFGAIAMISLPSAIQSPTENDDSTLNRYPPLSEDALTRQARPVARGGLPYP